MTIFNKDEKKENIDPGNKKKEKITREKSFKIIEDWVDTTRSRVYGEDLEDLQKILWIAVIDERLKLDEGTKRDFTYILEEPIQKKDGSGSISLLKIKSATLGKVFESENKKSDSEATISMIQTYCKLSDGEDLAVGFVTRIDPRDSLVLQAVIKAFFF